VSRNDQVPSLVILHIPHFACLRMSPGVSTWLFDVAVHKYEIDIQAMTVSLLNRLGPFGVNCLPSVFAL